MFEGNGLKVPTSKSTRFVSFFFWVFSFATEKKYRHKLSYIREIWTVYVPKCI